MCMENNKIVIRIKEMTDNLRFLGLYFKMAALQTVTRGPKSTDTGIPISTQGTQNTKSTTRFLLQQMTY